MTQQFVMQQFVENKPGVYPATQGTGDWNFVGWGLLVLAIGVASFIIKFLDSKHKKELAEVQAANDALTLENRFIVSYMSERDKKYEKQIAELKSELLDCKYKHLDTAHDFRCQLDSKNREIEKLKNELLQKDELHISDLQNAIKFKNNIFEEYVKEFEGNLTSTLQQLETDNDSLTNELNAMKKKFWTQMKEIKRLEQENEAWKIELGSLTENSTRQVNEMEMQMSELNNKLATVEAANVQLAMARPGKKEPVANFYLVETVREMSSDTSETLEGELIEELQRLRIEHHKLEVQNALLENKEQLMTNVVTGFGHCHNKLKEENKELSYKVQVIEECIETMTGHSSEVELLKELWVARMEEDRNQKVMEDTFAKIIKG